MQNSSWPVRHQAYQYPAVKNGPFGYSYKGKFSFRFSPLHVQAQPNKGPNSRYLDPVTLEIKLGPQKD